MSLFGWIGWEYRFVLGEQQTMMNHASKQASLSNISDIGASGSMPPMVIKTKDDRVSKYFHMRIDKYGDIIVEEWPEGLVVWVGGVIVYRSWK